MRTVKYPAHHSAVANVPLTAMICQSALSCKSCSGTSHSGCCTCCHTAGPAGQALLQGCAQLWVLRQLQPLLRENQLQHPSKLPEDLYYQELLEWAWKSPGLPSGFCFCLNAHVAIREDLFQCFLLSHAIAIICPCRLLFRAVSTVW